MATTIASKDITNILTKAPTLIETSGSIKCIVDEVNVPAGWGDIVGDVATLCLFPTTARAIGLWIMADRLSTGPIQITLGTSWTGIGGNQQKEGHELGEAIDPVIFGNTSSFNLTNRTTSWASIVQSTGNPIQEDVFEIMWKRLGFSKDPGGYFCVSLNVTNTTSSGISGKVAARLDYV